MAKQRTFIAIDLKSFYASVECVERGLDPLLTNLVVADPSRTEKTICLAVSPSLKSYGIGGRARLFEVVERVRQVNMERLCFSPEGIAPSGLPSPMPSGFSRKRAISSNYCDFYHQNFLLLHTSAF